MDSFRTKEWNGEKWAFEGCACIITGLNVTKKSTLSDYNCIFFNRNKNKGKTSPEGLELIDHFTKETFCQLCIICFSALNNKVIFSFINTDLSFYWMSNISKQFILGG